MAKTTSAERMKRMRQRAREIAWNPARVPSEGSLSDISLSGLLELLCAEARKCHGDNERGRAMCAAFMRELGQRLEIEVEATYSSDRY